ncbi:MAG TPA: NADPH:quinone oxidoreductase family protein [Acidimicrobiales bacterium]|nr:NADPH:quinone oxidoreductase family protein [Acidimicrobiales bacterium]
MRAAYCVRYGPPATSVVIEDLPDPVPGDGQVVVRVAAAGVNYPDALIVGNRYQASAPLPFIPGSEFAGTVAAVGPSVAELSVGDRVRGGGFVGAFAELVVAPARSLRSVPADVDFGAAAAYGVTYETAFHALVNVARVQPGEWVAVLGAAGGVGSAAVELAHLLGAKVVAAASSPAKLEVSRSMGADAVIDYSTEDLKDALRSATGGGADVVIDPVGGAYSEPALRAMRWGGRFVVVGFASGEIPRIPLNLVLLKGVTITAFEFRGFGEHHPEATARATAELSAMLASGRIRPHISAVHPLDEAALALEDVLERRATGKVVITP